MNRIPVSSSNIKTIGYDNDSSILEIEFKSNSIYQYYNVPEQIYNNFLSASSKGKFHDRFIKEKYSYKQIR